MKKSQVSYEFSWNATFERLVISNKPFKHACFPIWVVLFRSLALFFTSHDNILFVCHINIRTYASPWFGGITKFKTKAQPTLKHEISKDIWPIFLTLKFSFITYFTILRSQMKCAANLLSCIGMTDNKLCPPHITSDVCPLHRKQIDGMTLHCISTMR